MILIPHCITGKRNSVTDKGCDNGSERFRLSTQCGKKLLNRGHVSGELLAANIVAGLGDVRHLHRGQQLLV